MFFKKQAFPSFVYILAFDISNILAISIVHKMKLTHTKELEGTKPTFYFQKGFVVG